MVCLLWEKCLFWVSLLWVGTVIWLQCILWFEEPQFVDRPDFCTNRIRQEFQKKNFRLKLYLYHFCCQKFELINWFVNFHRFCWRIPWKSHKSETKRKIKKGNLGKKNLIVYYETYLMKSFTYSICWLSPD